ncbi:flagellar hook-length control protein FliK, partial [bacterium]|nr:flagellar hook-length control protein FliK [bacterium]
DSNDNLITEENSDEDNTTTITQNEDPTMYKQLQTTLENPTALYVLTSQTNLNTQNNSQENENLLPADQAIKYAEKAETTTTEKFTLIEPTKSQPKENVSNQKTLRDIVDEKVLKELNVEAVSSSEEGGEAAGNLMQYQTPQEQAVKVMLHNDIKFEDMKTVSAQNQTKLQEAAAGRILEQVSKQMEGMCNSSKVNIVLNPASLGKVVLQLVNSKEGLIAHFTVNNADTQNALMKGLAGLKESLLAQGINVDNVVIKLSESDLQDGEQEQSWTQKDDSSGGNKGQGTRKQKQEKKNFEQMMFEMDQD